VQHLALLLLEDEARRLLDEDLLLQLAIKADLTSI